MGLAVRDREILILRTAWRCRGRYEWHAHVRLGIQAGLSVEEFGRLARDDVDGSWSRHEAALIAAVDELHAGVSISDGTWMTLAETLDAARLVEVPLVVGQYHSLSFLTNVLGTPIDGLAADDDVFALPARPSPS